MSERRKQQCGNHMADTTRSAPSSDYISERVSFDQRKKQSWQGPAIKAQRILALGFTKKALFNPKVAT